MLITLVGTFIALRRFDARSWAHDDASGTRC